jgi:sugar phosphate isomerase/epimerase
MVDVGICTISFAAMPVDEALAVCAETGTGGVELWGREHLPADASATEVARVRARAEALNLAIPAYGSYLVAGVDEWGPERVGDTFARMQDLGISRMRVWAGNQWSHEATPDVWDRVISALRLWGDLAAQCQLRLVVERHAGTLTDETAPARQLIERVQHPCVHLNYQVPLPWPMEHYRTRMGEDLQALLPLSDHMHLQNYTPTEGQFTRAPLTEGVIDYRAWRPHLDETGYTGWAMLEFLPEGTDKDPLTLARQEFVAACTLLKTPQ